MKRRRSQASFMVVLQGRLIINNMTNNLVLTFNVNGFTVNVGDGCDFYDVETLLDAINEGEFDGDIYDENDILIRDDVDDIESLFENCFLYTSSNIINDDLIKVYLYGLDYDEYQEAIEKLDDFLDNDSKVIDFIVENFDDLDDMIDNVSDVINLLNKYDIDALNTIIDYQGIDWLINHQDDFNVYENMTGEEIAEDYVWGCYPELDNRRLICGYVMNYLDFEAIWRDMKICGNWIEYDGGWIEIYQ
jgi:hypothetical protein